MALKPGFSLMDWNNLVRSADVARGQYSTTRQITLEELRKKANWCCIRGKVYDFSQYIPYHPGGADELLRGAADDCTNLFDEFHPWVNVDKMFARCQVGVLVDPNAVWVSAPVARVEAVGGEMFRVRFDVSDTAFLRALKETREKDVLFHVKLRTKLRPNGPFVERPYTPLIGDYFDPENSDDSLSLLVKQSGRKDRLCFTHALCSERATQATFEVQLKPCHTIKMDWYLNSDSIGMVCAGSGITPALQIISREALSGETSRKRLFLVWCNRDEAHTCLRPELHALLTRFNGRLTIVHLFSRIEKCTEPFLDAKHEYEEIDYGRFDEEFLAKRPTALPKPGENGTKSAILMCGTWDFERSVRATMFMNGFSSDALIRIPG